MSFLKMGLETGIHSHIRIQNAKKKHKKTFSIGLNVFPVDSPPKKKKKHNSETLNNIIIKYLYITVVFFY